MASSRQRKVSVAKRAKAAGAPRGRAMPGKALRGRAKASQKGKIRRAVTLAQIRAIMPNLSRARARQLLRLLNRAMKEASSRTARRMTAFLAKLARESRKLRAEGAGKPSRGRGRIQVTGRVRYSAAGKAQGTGLGMSPRGAASLNVRLRVSARF